MLVGGGREEREYLYSIVGGEDVSHPKRPLAVVSERL